MINMRILIDTNVILDWLMCREPFQKEAKRIMEESIFGDLEGYITAHSLTDLFYILRKDFNVEKRKELLLLLCEHLQIIPEDANTIKSALNQKEWLDLEDGLQMQCARERNLDYIVTRNIRDFSASSIPVLMPGALMEFYDKNIDYLKKP